MISILILLTVLSRGDAVSICEPPPKVLPRAQAKAAPVLLGEDWRHKDKPLLANGIPQSYHSSIITISIIATTNWIHHFRVSTVVYHNVESTVRFGWCLEQAVPFHFSQYNDRFFYGHTFITNSGKVQRRVRKAQKQTGFPYQNDVHKMYSEFRTKCIHLCRHFVYFYCIHFVGNNWDSWCIQNVYIHVYILYTFYSRHLKCPNIQIVYTLYTFYIPQLYRFRR